MTYIQVCKMKKRAYMSEETLQAIQKREEELRIAQQQERSRRIQRAVEARKAKGITATPKYTGPQPQRDFGGKLADQVNNVLSLVDMKWQGNRFDSFFPEWLKSIPNDPLFPTVADHGPYWEEAKKQISDEQHAKWTPTFRRK